MKEYKFRKTFTYEGKRYTVRGDSEKECYEKMALKKRDMEEGRVMLCGSMLVRDWAYKCFDTFKSKKLGDLARQNSLYRMEKYVIEPIGDMRLKDVKQMHLQNILNGMEGMSSDYIRKVHGIIRMVFRHAMTNDLIQKDPSIDLVIPDGTKTHRRDITEIERNAILSAANTDPRYVYFLFMLLCGLRPSEVAGLQGQDVQGDMLHVRGTKTAAADRYVPIPDYLRIRLPELVPFKPLFTSAGHELTISNRRHLWNSFLRQINIAAGCKTYRNQLIPPYPIAPDLTPYCLRHTYCSDLCRAGIDIRTAQKLMGHSNISTTADIYTHIDRQQIKDAGEKLEIYRAL